MSKRKRELPFSVSDVVIQASKDYGGTAWRGGFFYGLDILELVASALEDRTDKYRDSASWLRDFVSQYRADHPESAVKQEATA